MGIGFFGDFLRATSFENCIAAIISNTSKSSILEVERGEKTSTLSYNTDTVIEIATDRGYWPVKLANNSGGVDKWEVELAKLKDVHIPVHAVLTSVARGKKEGSITDIRMAWLEVNEPLELGESAILRISKKVGAIPKK